MADMRELLPAYKALFEPDGAGAKALRSDSFGDMYAKDIHSFLPGTWVIAGHHHGRNNILKLLDAVRRVWTVRSVFHNNNYWIGEDTICTEWFSTNGAFNGNRCRNSGLTRQTFRDGKVVEWQEYTDSEFFQEVHEGWREAVGPELGAYLSKYVPTGPPWYPVPAKKEWPLDTSLSDGQACVPEHMRERLEATRQWWAAPRAGTMDLFADDVQVYYQGRLWPLGGHHQGRQSLERLFNVAHKVWPEPSDMVKAEFWANDDSVLIHWFTRNKTWQGVDCRNSGWSVWNFRGEKVANWRNYVDTSFYAEVHEGWRDAVGEELGSGLPNWREAGLVRYPDPMAHE